MRYRELGNTGMKVSEIGLGCEGFVGKNEQETQDLLNMAQKHGVNYLDLYTPDPDLRDRIGKALNGRRDKFFLQGHLCTIWQDGQYKRTRQISEVREGFEDMLHRLDTSCIEVGMIHYVDSLKDWKEIYEGPVMEYARELKASGKIRYIGMSSHNPEAAAEAVKSKEIQVLMFSVNPCYDLQPAGEDCGELWDDKNYEGDLVNMDPSREALYELCSQMGTGITVMKAFGGGDLLSEELSPAGKALTPSQCIHYALTRPAVSSVLAGAHSPGEMKASLYYEEAGEAEKDYARALASFPNISWQGHCMYCGHCAPCPKGIDVASVTKFLNLAKARKEVPETVREHYALLEHKASECVGCGICETRCPFGVPIADNMKNAAEVFQD
ncbi:MAG: aldo/keto reductase [Anaerostipes sp.]|nr:aldo/keto reductase [Anaerostipes sp.]MBS7009227.1 aldo/keto reductase [Anaerostipes sp.]